MNTREPKKPASKYVMCGDEIRVTELLSKGWELWGSPIVIFDQGMQTWRQAVILRESTDEKTTGQSRKIRKGWDD